MESFYAPAVLNIPQKAGKLTSFRYMRVHQTPEIPQLAWEAHQRVANAGIETAPHCSEFMEYINNTLGGEYVYCFISVQEFAQNTLYI